MKIKYIGKMAMATTLAVALAACVTGPSVSPVEVTRFHQSAAASQLGAGMIFIESAPGEDGQALDLAPYKAAIASELAQLGYREASRDAASQIAQIRVERYISSPAGKRNPVSVGVGGSTGSYGSGVGLGLGVNLGGGKREMRGTDLGVMIRDKPTNNVIWEGRASILVSDNSQFASSSANASAISEALFREFPGNNGETIEVRVAN